jgi:hypothetical protein
VPFLNPFVATGSLKIKKNGASQQTFGPSYFVRALVHK